MGKIKVEAYMNTTISLNNCLVAKINGIISNHKHLEKKKFYVLIDLIVHCKGGHIVDAKG
jgi:hypothetical protein